MTNIVNIIESLSDKIANSTSEQEILYLSKAIEKIKLGNIILAATYQDMLNDDYPNGTVYYVEGEEAIYYKYDNYRFSMLTSSFNAFAWGRNNYGQLGINSTTTQSSPVSVVGGFTDWIQVSAGYRFHLAVRANGTAWSWGRNNLGQLGDNTITNRSSPVSVVGGFTDWAQVSAGARHSLGLRNNGTAWAWGQGASGELGVNDTPASATSPLEVVGGFTDWIQVSAGSSGSNGVLSDGTIWSWGTNNSNKLGNGDSNTNNGQSSPVSVVGGFADWTQVSAGSFHVLAIRDSGSAWAWGRNSYGQLGDNTTTSRSSPVSVFGGFTDWVQVSAGGGHSLGVRANGSAWAWGANSGNLGDNTITSRRSPVSVVGGFTDWVQVSAGGHSLGIRANGTAWAWGYNSYGRLGDGTTSNKSSPVSVVGGFADWFQVSAGDQSIALRAIK